MRNLRDIRRRIKSVKSTQQITKAMKMVAAARLKKAQDKLNLLKNYSETIYSIFDKILPLYKKISHPYFRKDGVKKRLILIIAGDKGLCGSYNSQIFEEFLKHGAKLNLKTIPVGTRTVAFIKKNNFEILKQFTNIFKDVERIPSCEIFDLIESSFLSGEVQEVFVLSQRFVSMGKTPIVFEKILPMESKTENTEMEYLFDPPFELISTEILKRYLETKIYQILIESYISEQFARMVAMELATKNADDMIEALTLLYNRMRQAAITKELIEIMSGAESLRRR